MRGWRGYIRTPIVGSTDDDHVALAEHWYATRVDVPSEVPDRWSVYPAEPFERLRAIRDDVDGFLHVLADVPDGRRDRQWTVEGERWTVAKVVDATRR